MAGINLSQSIQAKQAQAKVRFFDRGLVFMVVIIILLLVSFGASRWYLGTLKERMAALDTEVNTRTASLKGGEVDRVADFVDRLGFIDEYLSTETDPIALLADLERFTLPSVRLTLFEHVAGEKKTRIGGEAASLKEIAQQMATFKQMDGVREIAVEKVEYNKEARLMFIFALTR